MANILHLSDLHVHAKAGHKNNLRLGAIVGWAVDHYAHSSVNLVVTGDLVDNGAKEEYEQLVPLLMPLKRAGFRLLAAPGNHDCGLMGNA